MTSTNFYIIHTETGDMIRDIKSMLKISIRRLEEIAFEPNPSELQFYSKYENGHIVFETVNIKDYLRPMVASALQWYTEYIGQPNMPITNEDPRPGMKTRSFTALANISQTVE